MSYIARDGRELTEEEYQDHLRSQQLLHQAILLERAARVIRRAYPKGVLTDVTIYTTVSWLSYQARAWRRDAEEAEREQRAGSAGRGPEEEDQRGAVSPGEG